MFVCRYKVHSVVTMLENDDDFLSADIFINRPPDPLFPELSPNGTLFLVALPQQLCIQKPAELCHTVARP